MNKDIKLIEVFKKNNKIIYKYNNDTRKAFKIKENDKGLYIDADRLYYIIEHLLQIEKRLASGDFENCIVLIKIDLKRFSFSKDNINFKDTIFCENVDFSYSTFNSVYFTSSTFLKQVFFRDVIFRGEVYFNIAIFQNISIFNHATFIKKVNFNFVSFHENVYYHNTSFQDNVSFKESIFIDRAIFSEAIFFKEVNFESSSIEKLELDKINKDDKNNFILNLKYANIENISYTDANIKKAFNRDTFLILKNLALKNNDQISGLFFYVKEINQHKKEAKGFDKFLLYFEWGASHFGTKGWLPILWILGINLLFIYSFFSLSEQPLNNYIHYFTISLNPTKTIEDIFGSKYCGGWEIINYIKNILFTTLIYQTIKSFRKFSRKL